MSSFFLKGVPRQQLKRKGERRARPARPTHLSNLQAQSGESGSELEDGREFSPGPGDESEEEETAAEKKLRLAKKYLEEIAREEEKRSEDRAADELAVTARLKLDRLESQGRLRVQVADGLRSPSPSDATLVRARDHRLSLTCICVSADGAHLYSGSKCSTLIKWSLSDKKKLICITHKTSKFLRGPISSIAVTSDSKYLATSDSSSDVNVWDPTTMKHLHSFKGHKDAVTGLVFRRDTHTLYSASNDRSVKIWSLDEMSYVETLFGHQAPISAIDAGARERAVTSGSRDSTVRIWKIVEESQLIFNGPQGSLDEVRLLDEEHFVSGSDNGSICVWSVLKKKPLSTVTEAHGSETGVPRWITSLGALFNSDTFASGSYDGNIKLWKVCDSYRKINPLFDIEVKGFINCIQFGLGGKYLYAAVGQEHKRGRWWRDSNAKNGILHVNFNLTEKIKE